MGNRKKSPGKNGFKYRPQYGVIILCKDEREQSDTYTNLKKAGSKCRVVTV